MALMLPDLTPRTRSLMEEELEADENDGAGDRPYLSPRLSEVGRDRWVEMLRDALRVGSDATLALAVAEPGILLTQENRATKRGVTSAKVPVTAPVTLAEGEFNRYYIRAVCRQAIERDAQVLVYRARHSDNPRSASLALEGSAIDPGSLLHDLRTNVGCDTALGLPPGLNSGLSVRLT